ncbi:putative RNA-binding protein [Smittium culicis]|uniref:Putative RNA-binding protein n=1 Tax=Smittium culicis TaxID=133412 RepID=A0A1R1Y9K4_9FUNG|nr:putative RNA-binding protein [Smittium culicis]
MARAKRTNKTAAAQQESSAKVVKAVPIVEVKSEESKQASKKTAEPETDTAVEDSSAELKKTKRKGQQSKAESAKKAKIEAQESEESDYSDAELKEYSEDGVSAQVVEKEVAKLQTKLKAKPAAKHKKSGDGKVPNEGRVVYIGRIPHGFYEAQMKLYFKQFGTVTRLKLMRNRKTGRSKHFAFVEFENSEVAAIACETMDNYLLFNRLLKCKVLTEKEIHADLFKGAGQKKFRITPNKKINQVNHNKMKTQKRVAKDARNLLKLSDKRNKKFAELGINYSYTPTVPASVTTKTTTSK